MVTRAELSKVFEAIDRKDADGFVSFLTEDATFRFGSQEAVNGREAVRAAVAAFFESIEGLSHRVMDTWQGDGSLVMEGEVTYRTLDQREVTVPFVDVFRLQDGRIKDYLVYIDPSPLAP